MKLEVFQSDKGDCLLLEGADGKRILIDGGMPSSYREHVAPALAKLAAAGQEIDVCYVSHIDDDHIAGILRMLDDLAEWVVFDHHRKQGDADFREPKSPRPPKPKRIWHNAFRDTVKANAGDVADLLAARAKILSGADDEGLRRLAADDQNLAQGVKSALRVSRRVGPHQLGIPLNPEFEGKLMFLGGGGPKSVKVGGMKLSVLGPRAEDLKKLRRDWNTWLKANRKAINEIRAAGKAFESDLGSAEVGAVLGPMLAQASALGNRDDVTPPNLASLMFLAEEGSKSILLTGDGFAGDVLKGLADQGKLGAGGDLHVDVLKVPHHGAIANIDQNFCEKVTADHYVFCGNGADHNPELEVVELIAECRFGAKTSAAVSARPFTFWFNSSPEASTKHGDHMQEVVDLVARLAKKSKKRLRSRFLNRHAFTLNV
jgi:beta-lactamase superfamily II metal-dependent hydrolase